VEADRNAEAIAEYKLAIERAPRQSGLHEALADLYWTTGKLDEADAAYQQELAIDPYSATSNYKLGSLRVIVGKPAEGIAYLKQAVKLDPDFGSAFYYLGRAQVDSGDDAEGLANLQRASTMPGDATVNTLAFYQMSRAYRRLHRMDEANAALARFRELRDAAAQKETDKETRRVEQHRSLPQAEPLPTDAEAAGQS
jgi:tetratricopeptide (TPR) repeat protein